ncbi:MAG: very short patch repair endonuclease [Chloracidobacterium sp. CP2_5A]|nr:MAG: very short patch repair endonuclease [Chloracidobacterium sp. CP2_5A]
MDIVDRAKRGEVMRAVKSRDTRPEMIVRRMLHRAGFRYRLHDKKLAGKPDIVFPSRKKVIFVHGCFWHQHPGCRLADRPASNVDYWNAKLDGNVARDAKRLAALAASGWKSYVVWECQIRDAAKLLDDLSQFLSEA